MTEDGVDPEDPRPEGHYPRFRDNTWHYVPDELAQTISLGPAGDGGPGQDWVLSYTPERRNEEDREKVFVRLTLRALHELYIETKDLSPDARQVGHTAECALCGEQVALEDAWPDDEGGRRTRTIGARRIRSRSGVSDFLTNSDGGFPPPVG